jgi:hypothetical protein
LRNEANVFFLCAHVQPARVHQQKHACPAAPRDLNLFPVAATTKPCAATAAAAAAPAVAGGATATYHSVCTIEKVKTALERFERGRQHQSPHPHQQQQHSGAGASPSSSSVTTSSVKRRGGGGGGGGGVEQGDGCDSPSGGGMVAAACPRCFLYVLISRSDPRCPRCESHVPAPPAPAPAASKKPRIDLNVGYLGT